MLRVDEEATAQMADRHWISAVKDGDLVFAQVYGDTKDQALTRAREIVENAERVERLRGVLRTVERKLEQYIDTREMTGTRVLLSRIADALEE